MQHFANSIRMNLAPIEKPETLKMTARRAIKNLLVSGQLEKGSLYSANTFADILGVSRTPVREALLELSAEGYLIAHDGKGFRVKEPSVKEIQDFFETRMLIELYVLKRVVAQLPAEVVKRLRAHHRRMEESLANGENVAFISADESFHLELIQSHDNHHLLAVMNNIRDRISIIGHEAIMREGRASQVIKEHQAILEAIEARDAARAVAAMRVHLQATESSLVTHLPASASTDRRVDGAGNSRAASVVPSSSANR